MLYADPRCRGPHARLGGASNAIETQEAPVGLVGPSATLAETLVKCAAIGAMLCPPGLLVED
eukprot:8232291-Alexandrium_andersonii.AAC.1